MSDLKPTDKNQESNEIEKRREFLKKSAYAAYASPVMLSLLHSKNASASNFYQPDPNRPSHWVPKNDSNGVGCQANNGQGKGTCNE